MPHFICAHNLVTLYNRFFELKQDLHDWQLSVAVIVRTFTRLVQILSTPAAQREHELVVTPIGQNGVEQASRREHSTFHKLKKKKVPMDNYQVADRVLFFPLNGWIQTCQVVVSNFFYWHFQHCDTALWHLYGCKRVAFWGPGTLFFVTSQKSLDCMVWFCSFLPFTLPHHYSSKPMMCL